MSFKILVKSWISINCKLVFCLTPKCKFWANVLLDHPEAEVLNVSEHNWNSGKSSIHCWCAFLTISWLKSMARRWSEWTKLFVLSSYLKGQYVSSCSELDLQTCGKILLPWSNYEKQENDNFFNYLSLIQFHRC